MPLTTNLDIRQSIQALYQFFAERPACGFEQVSVLSSGIAKLTPPLSARSALIYIEASASSATPTKCIRFTEDGTAPTSTVGSVLGDLSIYECSSHDNLISFQAINPESGKTTTLNVTYYR